MFSFLFLYLARGYFCEDSLPAFLYPIKCLKMFTIISRSCLLDKCSEPDSGLNRSKNCVLKSVEPSVAKSVRTNHN